MKGTLFSSYTISSSVNEERKGRIEDEKRKGEWSTTTHYECTEKTEEKSGRKKRNYYDEEFIKIACLYNVFKVKEYSWTTFYLPPTGDLPEYESN